MKHTILTITALTVMLLSLASCDDTTDTLGMSLTESVNNLSINADTFYVESHSVAAKDIVARSAQGYIGNIKDPETNSYITCNYMTQFTTLGDYQFPSIENIRIENYDKTKQRLEQVEADSCELIIFFSRHYGDSLALMKITAHEMNTPYEENNTYTTDFDPINQNMIREGEGSIHSEMSYTFSNQLHSDESRWSSTYTPYISISLNGEYIDKQGKHYNNYGTYIMRKFYEENGKDIFSNNYRFNHEVCPGFYLQHKSGLGSLSAISLAQLRIHFTDTLQGNVGASTTILSGTEEVLQKTNIKQNTNAIDNLIEEETCTYLKTPAGIFTELSLPIDKIMLGRDNEETSHDSDTLNTVRIFIPRINDKAYTSYNLPIPKTVLLLPTDSASTFFANKQVADYRTSYIATYSSTTNGYTFANISALITKAYSALNDTINNVINAKKQELGTEELTETMTRTIKKAVAEKYMNDHPTWNKAIIIPVETTYSTLSSTSSELTKVAYDMHLGSTRLQKGYKNNDNITVSVIYSKFKE